MELINWLGEKLWNKIPPLVGFEDVDKKFYSTVIENWRTSPTRTTMLVGDKYYRSEHDILKKVRTGSEVMNVDLLPNNKIINNWYAKIVDQKVGYLLAKPFTVKSDIDTYVDDLNIVFDVDFRRSMNHVGVDCMNCGIGYLHPYIDQSGIMKFKRFRPWDIIPLWKDEEHKELDAFIRIVYNERYNKYFMPEVIEHVEIYTAIGVQKYALNINGITPIGSMVPYVSVDGKGYSWGKVPLVTFRGNMYEIPLINRLKSLQDALNEIYSNFADNVMEDPRSTILVLKNYDGTDLIELKAKVKEHGVIKVRTVDGVQGGVETLEIHVNAENYKVIMAQIKRALIENGRGIDGSDDRMSNNPNQMNIQAIYSDIDLDADIMEMEFKYSFQVLFSFVNKYLVSQGKQVDTTDVDIIFNRDVLINETEVIQNLVNSSGILSQRTIIEEHPYVIDATMEKERLEEEKEDGYDEAFPIGVKDEEA